MSKTKVVKNAESSVKNLFVTNKKERTSPVPQMQSAAVKISNSLFNGNIRANAH